MFWLFYLGTIILILAFFIWNSYMSNKKYKEEKEKNLSLIKEKEELLNEKESLKEEYLVLTENIEQMYRLIKEIPNVGEEFIEKLKQNNNTFMLNHSYTEFISRIEEELERKKRYDFVYFSIMKIRIDFYDEYVKLYGDEVSQIDKAIKEKLSSGLRKIDYVADGKNKDSLYVLLPMTELNGASILGNRIRDMARELSNERIITLTIAICEIEKEENMENIFEILDVLDEEGSKSGGNVIKVERC